MSVDVLIGQAYFLRFDQTLWAAGRPYPPLGALYAASCVRANGYRVELFDAMLAASVDDWEIALDAHSPGLAVIYEDSFNYLSKMCLLRMRAAALLMIAAARRRGVPVIVAGSDASDHPATYLDHGAFAVIAGEGEITLQQLVDTLLRKAGNLETIEGIVFTRNGVMVRTAPRAIVRDLDSLPRPAWDLVDVEHYRSIWMRRHGFFSMNVATTRGCPYHCNWCAKPIYGQRYSARSPENVADEIAWLKRTYEPDHLWITDDIFGLKPGWVERFARTLVERNSVVPFKCLMRADGVDERVVTSLVAAGCQTVWVGAESGSQRVLDAMEKGTRVDQIENAARLLHLAGIEVGFFLQFGYPGELLSDIEQTLALVDRCQPDDIGVSVSYPLPGTPFYDRVRSQLGEKRNWLDSADLAMMYQAAYSPDFYRALHRFVHARFRAARGLTQLRDLMSRPHSPSKRELVVLAQGSVQAAVRPLLWRRVKRLALAPPSTPAVPVIVPLLTRQAAALPSEQSR
jgi:anaerobic magnesium-protoporphyrin IX monomethyl ester cyclase